MAVLISGSHYRVAILTGRAGPVLAVVGGLVDAQPLIVAILTGRAGPVLAG